MHEASESSEAESWDEGEAREGVKSPRAVVSVSFARADFEDVVAYARQHNMRTSEFIRRAALEAAAPRRPEPTTVAVSGSVYTAHPAIERPRPKIQVHVPAKVVTG